MRWEAVDVRNVLRTLERYVRVRMPQLSQNVDEPYDNQHGQDDRQQEDETGEEGRRDAVPPKLNEDIHSSYTRKSCPITLQKFASIVLNLCVATYRRRFPARTDFRQLLYHISVNAVLARQFHALA